MAADVSALLYSLYILDSPPISYDEPMNQVRITGKISYELVYIDEFKDKTQLGECRYEERQIVLKKGMSKLQQRKILLHEALHAMSYEYGFPIPHKTINDLEEPLERFMRLNR